MKTLIIIALLLFSAPAMALDRCYSGAWYEPATSGEGIDLQISDETVVLYRFAYLGGSPNYWVTSTANTDSDVLNFTAWQTLRVDTGIEVFDVGVITLRTNPENSRLSMTWRYDIDITDASRGGIPVCLTGGCSGSKELVHLFQPIGCQ